MRVSASITSFICMIFFGSIYTVDGLLYMGTDFYELLFVAMGIKRVVLKGGMFLWNNSMICHCNDFYAVITVFTVLNVCSFVWYFK